MKKIFLIFFASFSFYTYASPPEIVYRAVLEDPDYVKRDNGFTPKGMIDERPNQPPPNLSLFNHANGAETGFARSDAGYVSTTTSYNLAHLWVNTNLAGRGYIYHIQPTGNMIDVNLTLRQFSPHQGEMEYAALGRIYWGQIRGWTEISFGVPQPYVANPDYNRHLYDISHAGGNVPSLAGFPEDHRAWSMVPWSDYASCGFVGEKNKSSEECNPEKSAQEIGDEYFHKYTGILLFKKLASALLAF